MRTVICATITALLLELAGLAQPVLAAEKATLMTSANFIPEYAFLLLGKEKGYFAAEGIDLDVQEGRSAGPTLQQLGQGNIDFAFADTSTMIKAILAGAPIISVGVLQKKSLFSVMGFADRGINTPRDLIGKRIMMTPGDGVSQAFPPFLAINHINKDNITVVAGDVQTKRVTLMTGNTDMVGGNINDQGPNLEAVTGKKIKAVVFSDWGLKQVGSGIEVNRDFARKHPDIVRRFMRAAAKAYEATRANPEEAADAMLKIAPMSGKRSVIVESIKLGFPYHDLVPGKNPFYVSKERIADTVQILIKYAGVDQSAASRIDDFIDLQYVQ
jgi:NitT/TauT family transport system substrate-binding protein